MKFKLRKSFFIKVFFWIFVVLFVAAYNDFARFALPDAAGAGRKDDQSVAFFILSLILFFSIFNKNISRTIIALLILFLTFFAISNWWYFDFYRDFITPGAIKLAIYAQESTMAWDGLKYKINALYFVLSMLGFLAVLFSLEKYKPKKKTLFITALVFFGFAVQQQLVLSKIAKGGHKHRGVNHISYFIKGFVPREKFKLTSQHVEKIKKALPQKNIGAFNIEYPLFQAVEKTRNNSFIKKNVIFVVMESVRMSETGLYPNPGISNTPNLDNFAKQSINFKAHYANANQTVRGEVAILCSALDYINGGTFSMAGEALKTNCLPAILSQYGYETYWIHGYTKSFFNRENFFPKIGYQHLLDRDVINVKKDKNEIGWGVADEDVFNYAIDKLERIEQPFFAQIMTLSNHYPYLWDWGIEFPERLHLSTELQEDEDNLYPAYQRGIYYTDHALGKFLERFKQSHLYGNTLLVITGDHGIWTYPDELLNSTEVKSELQKNEKYFRLPLLIHAKDLQPDVIDIPASQVDITPTVLDYLGISYPNSFLGDSLFSREQGGDYPVYFMASGSYGVRRNNQYCYPVDTTGVCASHNRMCDSYSEVESKSVCFTSSEDLMVSAENLNVIEIDKSNDDVFIDLSQQFLDYGFLPPSEQIYKVFAEPLK